MPVDRASATIDFRGQVPPTILVGGSGASEVAVIDQDTIRVKEILEEVCSIIWTPTRFKMPLADLSGQSADGVILCWFRHNRPNIPSARVVNLLEYMHEWRVNCLTNLMPHKLVEWSANFDTMTPENFREALSYAGRVLYTGDSFDERDSDEILEWTWERRLTEERAEAWQAPLARALDVGRVAINRWCRGLARPDTNIFRERFPRLIHMRLEEMARVPSLLAELKAGIEAVQNSRGGRWDAGF